MKVSVNDPQLNKIGCSFQYFWSHSTYIHNILWAMCDAEIFAKTTPWVVCEKNSNLHEWRISTHTDWGQLGVCRKCGVRGFFGLNISNLCCSRHYFADKRTSRIQNLNRDMILRTHSQNRDWPPMLSTEYEKISISERSSSETFSALVFALECVCQVYFRQRQNCISVPNLAPQPTRLYCILNDTRSSLH